MWDPMKPAPPVTRILIAAAVASLGNLAIDVESRCRGGTPGELLGPAEPSGSQVVRTGPRGVEDGAGQRRRVVGVSEHGRTAGRLGHRARRRR